MIKDNMDEQVGKIETTIGELIEMITQIALEAGNNEEDSYKLTSIALESILRRNRHETVLVN